MIGTQAEVTSAAPHDSAAGSAGTTDSWVGVIVHRVAYDVESVAGAMYAVGLPDTLAEALRNA